MTLEQTMLAKESLGHHSENKPMESAYQGLPSKISCALCLAGHSLGLATLTAVAGKGLYAGIDTFAEKYGNLCREDIAFFGLGITLGVMVFASGGMAFYQGARDAYNRLKSK